MTIAAEQKSEMITKFKRHDGDTGSSEVQVALLTTRINNLTKHFETHVKDHASRRGLIKLVNQRRSLLTYLKNTSIDRYNKLIAELGLRK